MDEQRIERRKTCTACGAQFSCYTQNCWCSELPKVMPLPDQGDCLCPACLKKAIEEKGGMPE